MLHVQYLVWNENEQVEHVRQFLADFGLVEGDTVGGALYTIKQKRNRTQENQKIFLMKL